MVWKLNVKPDSEHDELTRYFSILRKETRIMIMVMTVTLTIARTATTMTDNYSLIAAPNYYTIFHSSQLVIFLNEMERERNSVSLCMCSHLWKCMCIHFLLCTQQVTGWGYDENGQITEELKMAKMPVVSQQVCLWSNRDFYPHFTSDRTYCAGFRNGMHKCTNSWIYWLVSTE